MKKKSLIKVICASFIVAISIINTKGQGIITTWTGNSTGAYSGDGGLADLAQVSHPYGIYYGNTGNFYIADQGNYAIRKINASTGIITTIAGNGTPGYSGDAGAATLAQLGSLYGIYMDTANNIYLTDGTNSVVREINAITGIITTIAGNGTTGYSGDGGAATNAALGQPEGLCIVSNNLYITDHQENCIRKVNMTSGVITTIAGNGSAGYTGDGGPASSCTVFFPSALCADSMGDLIFADEQNSVIRKISSATGIISTICGNNIYGFSGNGGPATNASLGYVQGICLDQYGNIYITDAYGSCRKITVSTGTINIVAGSETIDGFGGDGGAATAGLLNDPTGVCVDPSTGSIAIADYENNRIRKVTQPGFISPTKLTNTIAEAKLIIFPNPSAGIFSIQIPDGQNYSLANIFTISGEKIYSSLLKDNTSNIDVSNLSNGNYILSIQSASGNSFVEKITINK
jgi:hypothetical protein